MPYDCVLRRRRNQLDDGKPVAHGIMITRRQHGTDFEHGSTAPAPPTSVDPPSAVHPEMGVQGEVVAEAEELVLAARNHLAYPNPGQISRRQGGHPKLRSGQGPASKYLV